MDFYLHQHLPYFDINHICSFVAQSYILLNFQDDRELVEVLLGGNADPTFANKKGGSAYSLAQKSGRKLVELFILEANMLRKLHSFDEDAHSHIVDSIKEGEWT